MKKYPVILLLIAPYLLLIFIIARQEKLTVVGLAFLLFSVVLNVICILTQMRRRISGKEALFWNMILKLCHIPFYVMIFLIALLLNVFIIPLLPIIVFTEYLLLLSTTAYGIKGLIICFREDMISGKTLALHVFAHFFFCFDVISAIYCYIKIKKIAGTNP